MPQLLKFLVDKLKIVSIVIMGVFRTVFKSESSVCLLKRFLIAKESSIVKIPMLKCSRVHSVSDEQSFPVTISRSRDQYSSSNSSKYVVLRRYIPMTRKALVKTILDQDNIVKQEDRKQFKEFAGILDRAISGTFLGVLSELKTLYDPLNPDKETLIVKNYTKEEREKCETELLQKLSYILERASFYELPNSSVRDVLKQHPAGDVLVSVDPEKYDVLRIWVLGRELEPVQHGPWYMWPYQMVRNLAFPLEQFERYKRVVIAVRPKRQTKLHLKSFKDIRCANMEYLLPDGKIRMSQFDRRILGGTLVIGMTSVVFKLFSFLDDYKVDFMYIALAIAGVLGLRAWTMYKNKRNSYLVNLSRVLYFKAIANNRALLTLAVDRAEDEAFKGCLLAYAFLQASSRISLSAQLNASGSQNNFCPAMTFALLSQHINEWMRKSFQIPVEFDPSDPVQHLKTLKILTSKTEGEQEFLQVLPLSSVLTMMPSPSPASTETYDTATDDQLVILNSEAGTQEEHLQEIEEHKLGWDH